jgi:hypothetical protein
MTPNPLDPAEQAAFRELDGLRRITDLARGCAHNCACQQGDTMSAPLEIEDLAR